MGRPPAHLRLIRGADGLTRFVPDPATGVSARNGAAAAERRRAVAERKANPPQQQTYSLVNASPAKAQRKARDADLLMPSQVAALFRVSPKTVARWTKTGRLNATRTQGGHHRFDRAEVLRLLKESGVETSNE